MPDDEGKTLNEAAADEAGQLLMYILIALIILYIIERLPEIWAEIEAEIEAELSIDLFGIIWSWTYGAYIFLATILSVIFVAGIIYAVRHTSQIRSREKQERDERTAEILTEPVSPANPRWQHVEDLVSSDSDRDWRLAIIEADIMLDEMLRVIGYDQESLGDKLHAARQSDFRTVGLAWEAHKLRNNIAHEGSAYDLTHREARKMIDLYRQVFEEFSYL